MVICLIQIVTPHSTSTGELWLESAPRVAPLSSWRHSQMFALIMERVTTCVSFPPNGICMLPVRNWYSVKNSLSGYLFFQCDTFIFSPILLASELKLFDKKARAEICEITYVNCPYSNHTYMLFHTKHGPIYVVCMNLTTPTRLLEYSCMVADLTLL